MEALIAILFCLALQRFANIGWGFNKQWFENYLKWLHPWLIKLNEWVGIGLIVFPVVLILGALNLLFWLRLFGLFNLILTVGVLFVCLDARSLKNSTSAASILMHSFTQIFPFLFWFVIFGKFGVYAIAVYFMVSMTHVCAAKVDEHYEGIERISGQIKNILDWVPSRLLGFSFALAGNFTKGFSYCRKHVWLSARDVTKFAVDSGLAALDVNNDSTAALDLVDRTLIIWLVAIILIEIGSVL